MLPYFKKINSPSAPLTAAIAKVDVSIRECFVPHIKTTLHILFQNE